MARKHRGAAFLGELVSCHVSESFLLIGGALLAIAVGIGIPVRYARPAAQTLETTRVPQFGTAYMSGSEFQTGRPHPFRMQQRFAGKYHWQLACPTCCRGPKSASAIRTILLRIHALLRGGQ
jgi:hypothetical protein